MRFVKLTHEYGTYFVNVRLISLVETNASGHTFVYVTGHEQPLLVEESPEEVISGDY